MFEESRLLVERYYCALLASGTASRRAEYLLEELRGRLRALQWCHARLLELDAQIEARGRADITGRQPEVLKQIFTDRTPPDCDSYRHATLPFELQDEVRVLLEAFYYSAHRVRDVLRDGRRELTGIGTFEAVGVRNARNHLVEHPHKVNGVLLFSLATGGPVGPQLRPLRWSMDAPGTQDPGLHANAAEFESTFNSALRAGLDALAV